MKSLLEPYIRQNYVLKEIQTTHFNSYFEAGKTYMSHNNSKSITVESVINTLKCTFVTFFMNGKKHKKKVFSSLGGNQVIKINKYIISTTNQKQVLLFEKDYVEFVINTYTQNIKKIGMLSQ